MHSTPLLQGSANDRKLQGLVRAPSATPRRRENKVYEQKQGLVAGPLIRQFFERCDLSCS